MLAIVNYGHFWSRELIDWGTVGYGNAGSLRASRKAGASAWTADFRNQIAIYALFNEEREAVYIGQTGSGNQRLFHRLRHHSRGQLRDRWTNFSWFGFLEPKDKNILVPPTPRSNGFDEELMQERRQKLLDPRYKAHSKMRSMRLKRF